MADGDNQKAIEFSNDGTELLKQKLYDLAIMKFDKALELDPGLIEIWHNKGLAYREAKKYDKAIECFDKALELNPELYGSIISKGDTFITLGFFLEAWQIFNNLSENGISDDKVSKRIDTLKKEKSLEDAIAGINFYNNGEREAALDIFEKSIKKNPKDRLVWFFKGKCLKDNKKYEEAISNFNEIIGHLCYVEAYKEKALCLIAIEDFEEASLNIEEYLNYRPHDEEGQRIQAICEKNFVKDTKPEDGGKNGGNVMGNLKKFFMKIFRPPN